MGGSPAPPERDPLGITPSARMTAGIRAIETDRLDRQPLLLDQFARTLAGSEGIGAAQEFGAAKPEGVENILLRHRWIDEQTQQLLRGQADALILLGAGLDTRAHRFALNLGARVLEVDLPETSDWKKAHMQELLEKPDPVTYFGADLATKPIGELLAEASLSNCQPVFVMEGLLCYLAPTAAIDLLRQCLDVPGAVVFDFFDTTYATRSARNQAVIEQLKQGGEEIVGLLDPDEVDSLFLASSAKVSRSSAEQEIRDVLGLERDTGYLNFRCASPWV